MGRLAAQVIPPPALILNHDHTLITVPTDNSAPVLHEDAGFQSRPAAVPIIHEDPVPAATPPLAVEISPPSSTSPISDVYRDETSAFPVVHEPGAGPELKVGFIFRGVQLHPFNSSREALFSQFRLTVGAPPLQVCLDSVDGFLADAYRLLWFCSHTPADWADLRCKPVMLQAVIDQWADEPGGDSVVATFLAYQIYAASRPL